MSTLQRKALPSLESFLLRSFQSWRLPSSFPSASSHHICLRFFFDGSPLKIGKNFKAADGRSDCMHKAESSAFPHLLGQRLPQRINTKIELSLHITLSQHFPLHLVLAFQLFALIYIFMFLCLIYYNSKRLKQEWVSCRWLWNKFALSLALLFCKELSYFGHLERWSEIRRSDSPKKYQGNTLKPYWLPYKLQTLPESLLETQ